ncbi:50S ribosomal protein L4 [Candidatus Falkowbacteria bacterium]|nr:50S ribosomal protein L4 [Candidatus Falkowbacteria bacterium]
MKTAVYNLQGEKVGDVELNPYVFEIVVKQDVVHQIVVAQERNVRKPLAHTLDRSEVRGGGKKPWAQKGTGRARHGSIRSPLWIGGGVTFGPRNDRNYSVRVNKKHKNLALRMVLSDKAAEARLVVVEALKLPEMKTKKLNEILNKLPSQGSKAMIALAKTDDKIITAAKNLDTVLAVGAGSLNVIDLLRYKYLVISKAGLAEVEKVYGKK